MSGVFRINVFLLLLLLCLVLPCGPACAQNGVEEKADTIREAVVRADKNAIKKTRIGFERLDKSKIDNGFALFSGPDVIKTLQNLPGVSSGTELFSGLYVHGGDGADNLFMLDGVPVYQAGHIGGIFSTFNPSVIRTVDFYKSGFPASYGGRLSSIVDVMTADGDFYGYHGDFSLAFLDGRVHFEGPIVKSKSSFNISLRRSWIDLLTDPLFRAINSRRDSKGNEMLSDKYRFYDLNAKLTFRLGKEGKLSLNYYSGRDLLRAEKSDTEYDDNGLENKFSQKILFDWGSRTASVNFSRSGPFSINALAFFTNGDSKVEFDDRIIFTNVPDYDEEKLHNENARHRLTDYGLNVRLGYSPSQSISFDSGVSAIRRLYANKESVRSKADSIATDNSCFSNEAAAYMDCKFKVSDGFLINVGVRLAAFGSGEKYYARVEPRLSLSFPLLPSLTGKASYSRMNQFQHLVASSYLDLPTNMWMPSTEAAPPMSSDQFSLGLFLSEFHKIDIGLEGWWKGMDGMMLYDGINSFFPPMDNWETRFFTGKGKSYGLELSAEYSDEKVQASLYYTLSWSKRLFDEIYEDWFFDHFDSRNKITLTASWKPNARFDVAATWNYHTGYRMTMPTHILAKGTIIPEDLFSEPNNIRLPDYHRFDIGCNFRKTTKAGHRRVWNLSLYNAYCRLNPLFMVPDWTKSDGYKGKAYAIVPIIPSVGYSLTF